MHEDGLQNFVVLQDLWHASQRLERTLRACKQKPYAASCYRNLIYRFKLKATEGGFRDADHFREAIRMYTEKFAQPPRIVTNVQKVMFIGAHFSSAETPTNDEVDEVKSVLTENSYKALKNILNPKQVESLLKIKNYEK